MALENTEHPKCPKFDDAVRAETIISGYLVKKINKNFSHMIMIS